MNGLSSTRQALPHHNHHGRRPSSLSVVQILSFLAFLLAAFYSGLMLGLQSSDAKCRECLNDHSSLQRSMESIKMELKKTKKESDPFEAAKAEIIDVITKTKDKDDKATSITTNLLLRAIQDAGRENTSLLKSELKSAIQQLQGTDTVKESKSPTTKLIPDEMKSLFSGMARVDRDEFFQHYDVGVPKDESTDGNNQVLLLYSNSKSLPDKHSSGDAMPLLSAEDATQHCNTLKVVLTEPYKKNECMALVGQWESYHVHKFMRLPEDNTKNAQLAESNPLRHVSRLHIDSGLAQRIPTPAKVKEYNDMMVRYLSSLDTVLEELKPIAKKVAGNSKTIVVMVCNHGQSELLMNFACSARARGFDTSQVLVFATDVETKELAEGLGLAAFYDHTNYAGMPKDAAGYYADKTFTVMMMAKVYCVHMINQLGYDLLFQDVDVVWHRNPLDFFTNTTSPMYNYDIYFQDDGARAVRYQPYSPNSGFYFVRHNERTEYFVHSLLMAGNIIAQSGSHQNAMAAVLQEHSSWRGLHVKTLDRKMEEFPNGYHFQKKKDYMMKIMEGKSTPYVFHMSWTSNKDDKQLYFEQIGSWFVKDKCVGETASKIRRDTGRAISTETDLAGACCLAEPEVKCHYRDKPSKIPCKDSPPIDKNNPSWWP